MKHVTSSKNILVSLVVIATLSSCSFFAPKKVAVNQGGQQSGELLKGDPGQQGQPTGDSMLTGEWQLAFDVNGQAIRTLMRLNQNGNQFDGTATQEGSEHQFLVLNGQISDGQVNFYLSDGPNDPHPLQYTGSVQMVSEKDYQGPYMTGKYAAPAQGVQGSWEAELTASRPAPAQASGGGGAPAETGDGGGGSMLGGGHEIRTSGFTQDESGTPQLSGKWDCAYEWNFKTIKSTMYLEQDNDKVTGHGMDLNTKEKFVIEKGWYAYPKLTIIRKYEKGKGAASDRTLTFKAEVKKVNDSGYQGPYLSGKSQGGGTWEAQLVR
jgi:hypothetical protein